MKVTKYIALDHYEVMDAIQRGNKVLYVDREQLTACCINPLSVDRVCEILADAEKSEREKGYEYKRISRYQFWYIRIDEIPDAEELAEVNENESVSDE